jgi:hypothetical protein
LTDSSAGAPIHFGSLSSNTDEEGPPPFQFRMGAHPPEPATTPRRMIRARRPAASAASATTILPARSVSALVSLPDEPRVLSGDRQHFRDEENSTVDQLERFKCPICFDFLKMPVGCGRCSERFCRDCFNSSAPDCPVPSAATNRCKSLKTWRWHRKWLTRRARAALPDVTKPSNQTNLPLLMIRLHEALS